MIRRTRSGLACIRWDLWGVDWACTDPTWFEAVLAELAQMDPGCEVHRAQPERTFVAPHIARVCMPIKRDKRGRPEWDWSHREVAWWIMQRLCEQGWEPWDANAVFPYGPWDSDQSHSRRNSGDFSLRLVSLVKDVPL